MDAFDKANGHLGRTKLISADTLAKMAQDNGFILYPLSLPASALDPFKDEKVIYHYSRHFEAMRGSEIPRNKKGNYLILTPNLPDGYEKYVVEEDEAKKIRGAGFAKRIRKQIKRSVKDIGEAPRKIGKTFSRAESDFRGEMARSPELSAGLSMLAGMIPGAGLFLAPAIGAYGGVQRAKKTGQNKLAGGLLGGAAGGVLGGLGAGLGGGIQAAGTGGLGQFGPGFSSGVGSYTQPLTNMFGQAAQASPGLGASPLSFVPGFGGAGGAGGGGAGLNYNPTSFASLTGGGGGGGAPGFGFNLPTAIGLGGLAAPFLMRQPSAPGFGDFTLPGSPRQESDIGRATSDFIKQNLGDTNISTDLMNQMTSQIESDIDQAAEQQIEATLNQFEQSGMRHSGQAMEEVGKIREAALQQKQLAKANVAGQLHTNTLNFQSQLAGLGHQIDAQKAQELLGYTGLSADAAALKFGAKVSDVNSIRQAFSPLATLGLGRAFGVI